MRERSTKPWQHGTPVDPVSLRTRRWGPALAFVDVDLLLYRYGSPVAVIEFKRNHNRKVEGGERQSCLAMMNLATLAGVPFFVFSYDPGDWTFRFQFGNGQAEGLVPSEQLSEAEFVGLLYNLIGTDVPQDVWGRVL